MEDFRFDNHGSVTVLTPKTPAARQWINDHLPDDVMSWAGGVVIEPRYVVDVLAGLSNDGLTFNEL